MITQLVKNQSADAPPSFLEPGDGRRLAYCLTPGRTPGVVFMGGFKSDMTGTKAAAVQEYCLEEGVRCLRFDYSGHGRSSGRFSDGTIGAWKKDTLSVIDHAAPGENVLVGSSMGAWIALLVALERPEKVAGLIGIASAPDFTERLIWQQATAKQKKQLEQEGLFYVPDCNGGEPYPITKVLIEEGRNHLLLSGDIPLTMPVRLIHGTADADVPWRVSFELMERLKSTDIDLELVKGGDHRLSYPGHLALLSRTLDEVLAMV